MLDWMDGWISLTSLTSRSPDGDNKRDIHRSQSPQTMVVPMEFYRAWIYILSGAQFGWNHINIHICAREWSQKLGAQQIACGRDYGHWGQCGIKWYNFGKLCHIECYVMKIWTNQYQWWLCENQFWGLFTSVQDNCINLTIFLFFFSRSKRFSFSSSIFFEPAPQAAQWSQMAKALSWEQGYSSPRGRGKYCKPKKLFRMGF